MTKTGKNGVALYASDARQARADVGTIIDRIEQRLSPARLINDAADATGARISSGVESAHRRLKRNPIAVGAASGVIGLFAIRRLLK